MMKKIIMIAVLLLIVVVAILFVKSPVVAPKIDSVASTTPNSITINEVKITDGVYTLSPDDVKITWTGRKVVLKNWVDSGSIKMKEAGFEIKDNKIVSNEFVIDMTTISNKTNGAGKNEDKLTQHLESESFFDVEKFPTSTFTAKSFIKSSTTPENQNSRNYNIVGDMTIKGVTNEISIPVTFTYTDKKDVSVSGSVDLDRTKWNIKYGSGTFFSDLGDNVIDDMFNIAFDVKLKLGSVSVLSK